MLAFLNLKFAKSDLPIRIIMLAMKLRKIFGNNHNIGDPMWIHAYIRVN